MQKTFYLLGWVVIMSMCLYHLSDDNWILNNTSHPQPRAQCNQSLTAKRALTTIITSVSSEYITLVLVLGRSISMYSDIDCQFDQILLVPDHVILSKRDQQNLQSVGWSITTLAHIPAPANVNKHTVKHNRYMDCFFKLHVFNMTQYTEVLFVDADAILCGNVMDLFSHHMPRMLDKQVHLGWVYDVTPWSDNNTFNSGVMLIRPSSQLSTHLLTSMHNIAFDPSLGDQGLLNAVFDTRGQDLTNSVLRQHYVLPRKFNTLAHMASTNPALWRHVNQDARIFHFTWLKPTALFLLPRCAYMGTLRFCDMWQRIRDQLL